jgi:hypothetical protein
MQDVAVEVATQAMGQHNVEKDVRLPFLFFLRRFLIPVVVLTRLSAHRSRRSLSGTSTSDLARHGTPLLAVRPVLFFPPPCPSLSPRQLFFPIDTSLSVLTSPFTLPFHSNRELRFLLHSRFVSPSTFQRIGWSLCPTLRLSCMTDARS